MFERNYESAAVCAWIHYARPRPHWYLVEGERQKTLQATWAEVREQARGAGATFEGRFHIRGQHDFETVEFWKFPSSQAAYEHWQALVTARYPEFFAFSNNIGLEMAEGSQ